MVSPTTMIIALIIVAVLSVIVTRVWIQYHPENEDIFEEDISPEDSEDLSEQVTEYRTKLLDQIIQYIITSFETAYEDAQVRFYRTDFSYDENTVQFTVSSPVVFIFTLTINWKTFSYSIMVEHLDSDTTVHPVLRANYSWTKGEFARISDLSELVTALNDYVYHFCAEDVKTVIQEVATADEENLKLIDEGVLEAAVYALAKYIQANPKKTKQNKELLRSFASLVWYLRKVNPYLFDCCGVDLCALPPEVMEQYKEIKDDEK